MLYFYCFPRKQPIISEFVKNLFDRLISTMKTDADSFYRMYYCAPKVITFSLW